MAKFWIYLAVYLIGAISGIILWEKIGTDDVYRGVFRFKQKGEGNRQESQINLQTGNKPDKLTRQQKRAINKAARDAKKLIKNGPKS